MHAKKSILLSSIIVVGIILSATACTKQNKISSSNEKASENNSSVATTENQSINPPSSPIPTNSSSTIKNNSNPQSAADSSQAKVNNPTSSSYSTSTKINNSNVSNSNSPQSNITQNTTTPVPTTKPTKQYVMVGDSKEDVFSVMGKPSSTVEDSPDLTFWYNGSSCIIYLYKKGDGYKVVGWINNYNFLKVSMGTKVSSAPPITIGSTKEDVVRAIGTPTWNSPFFGIKNDNFPQWDYVNGQYIVFDKNYKVIAWNNTGGLKVNLGSKDPNAPPVKIGSTWLEVANALGTPTKIHVSDPTTTPESFSYSDCYIQFDFSGKAYNIMNNGNPKVVN